MEQLNFSLALIDPSSGRPVEVRFWGHTDAGAADHVRSAVESVLAGRLARNELAMPTITHSLPHLTAEIAQLARVSSLQLSASVPQEAIAPAAAAIAAAPTPMESVANAFANRAAERAAASVPTGVKMNVGGFNVKIGKNGINSDSLGEQLEGKMFDKLFGCAIVGGVVLLLGVITMGVIVKVIFFA